MSNFEELTPQSLEEVLKEQEKEGTVSSAIETEATPPSLDQLLVTKEQDITKAKVEEERGLEEKADIVLVEKTQQLQAQVNELQVFKKDIEEAATNRHWSRRPAQESLKPLKQSLESHSEVLAKAGVTNTRELREKYPETAEVKKYNKTLADLRQKAQKMAEVKAATHQALGVNAEAGGSTDEALKELQREIDQRVIALASEAKETFQQTSAMRDLREALDQQVKTAIPSPETAIWQNHDAETLLNASSRLLPKNAYDVADKITNQYQMPGRELVLEAAADRYVKQAEPRFQPYQFEKIHGAAKSRLGLDWAEGAPSHFRQQHKEELANLRPRQMRQQLWERLRGGLVDDHLKRMMKYGKYLDFFTFTLHDNIDVSSDLSYQSKNFDIAPAPDFDSKLEALFAKVKELGQKDNTKESAILYQDAMAIQRGEVLTTNAPHDANPFLGFLLSLPNSEEFKGKPLSFNELIESIRSGAEQTKDVHLLNSDEEKLAAEEEALNARGDRAHELKKESIETARRSF